MKTYDRINNNFKFPTFYNSDQKQFYSLARKRSDQMIEVEI